MGAAPYRSNTPPLDEPPLHQLVRPKQSDYALTVDLLLFVLEVVLGFVLS